MNIFTVFQVSKKPMLASFWTNFIEQIHWESILLNIGTKIGELVLLSLLFWVIDWLGRHLIRQVFAKNDPAATDTNASNRVRTIYTLSQNIFHYTVLFFYLYAILSVLGVPVGTLIAGAGIFSLALGLGAQGFVNDIVTGFFILLEHQIDVGDNVKVSNIEGTVSAIGLRTTQITSADGTLNFIPNRNLTIISNRSRNDMRVQIDLRITPTTPIQQLKTVIERTTQQLLPVADMVGTPEIQGTTTDQDGNLVFRIQFFAKNGAQAPLQRQFLDAYLVAVKAAGIKLLAAPLNLRPTASTDTPTSATSAKITLPKSGS